MTLAALGLVAVVALALGVREYRSWEESHAEAAFGAARRDFTAQKLDAAAQGFRRVTSDWPRTSHGQLALVYLGNTYAELGKTREAEDAFQQVLRRVPTISCVRSRITIWAFSRSRRATRRAPPPNSVPPPQRTVRYGASRGSRASAAEQQFVEAMARGCRRSASSAPSP